MLIPDPVHPRSSWGEPSCVPCRLSRPNGRILANALERFRSFKSFSQGICQLVVFGSSKIGVVVVPVPRSSVNDALVPSEVFFITASQDVTCYWDSCVASQLKTKRSKCCAGPQQPCCHTWRHTVLIKLLLLVLITAARPLSSISVKQHLAEVTEWK